MKWFNSLYVRFIHDLGKAIAIYMIEKQKEDKWVQDHSKQLTRARAITRLTAPEKVNDFEYIKQVASGKQG